MEEGGEREKRQRMRERKEKRRENREMGNEKASTQQELKGSQRCGSPSSEFRERTNGTAKLWRMEVVMGLQRCLEVLDQLKGRGRTFQEMRKM